MVARYLMTLLLPIYLITSSLENETNSCYVWHSETEKEIVTECEPYHVTWAGRTITKEEFELLCIATWCESGNQDLKTQTLVAKTMLNRLVDDRFPDSITEVIYQRNQYSVTRWYGFPELYDRKVTEQVEQAVLNAITTDDAPRDLFYFRNSFYHRGRVPYKNNGILYFCRQGDNW